MIVVGETEIYFSKSGVIHLIAIFDDRFYSKTSLFKQKLKILQHKWHQTGTT
jgi:hypothetical protein